MHVTERKIIINGYSEASRPFKDYFTNVEVEKINKIFEELIKDFKLYTKRCEAFNCKYSNEDELKWKNYFNQNKTKFIDPFCYNEYASNINLDCIKEYINKFKNSIN